MIAVATVDAGMSTDASNIVQTGSAAIEVRRSAERFSTRIGWLDSKHSFSFGHHYDPSDTGHGLLLVNNDDVVRGGAGFDTHPHRDMEIVTWVLSGELEHRDSEGNHGVLYPGLAQRMSAGRGILHSEKNHSATTDVHFVQMWVRPDTTGIDPGYEQRDVNDAMSSGELVAIASGQGHVDAVSIHQRDAVLWGARVPAGRTVHVPADRYVHVFVPVGSVELESAGRLDTGDAARLTDAGVLELTAGDSGAEVLIWATA
jgi:quercetin 2,3-dioxygenase